MDTKNYLNDLSEIKSLMSRSTQFISLSGLSGVMAGLYALVGAFLAKRILEAHQGEYVTLESKVFLTILLIAITVLFLSVTTAYILTRRKANKQGEQLWNSASKRLLKNFLIPLVTGGIFTLLLIRHEIYGLIVPVTLIFYGLACVNASKYTFRHVRYLGITIIITGLIATELPGYSIEFWALGFGVCHIIYGLIMHFKYERA